MRPNAFIGWPKAPSDADVAAALGRVKPLWDEIVESISEELNLKDREWKCPGRKYGWTLRLQRGKRNILHLSPRQGSFQVLTILGDRAVKAARDAQLSAVALKLLDEAPRYPEGTGIRLEVTSRRHLPLIRKPARIKLDN